MIHVNLWGTQKNHGKKTNKIKQHSLPRKKEGFTFEEKKLKISSLEQK